MQHKFLKSAMIKTLAFTALFVTLFTVNASAGLDTYSIYLNNKLILKQAVDQPLNLAGLQLDKANESDQLVIYYRECHSPNNIGSSRKIVVKDERGNTIKEWKFADVKGTDTGMAIPVKELLALKKQRNGRFTLVYAATLLPQGQKLTGVLFG